MPRRHPAGDAVLQEDHVAQGHRGRLKVRQREGVSTNSGVIARVYNVCRTRLLEVAVASFAVAGWAWVVLRPVTFQGPLMDAVWAAVRMFG